VQTSTEFSLYQIAVQFDDPKLVHVALRIAIQLKSSILAWEDSIRDRNLRTVLDERNRHGRSSAFTAICIANGVEGLACRNMDLISPTTVASGTRSTLSHIL
jgi:hypothetical protein